MLRYMALASPKIFGTPNTCMHTRKVTKLGLLRLGRGTAVLREGKIPITFYANPLLISYLFRDITYHLDPHAFRFSGSPCLSEFAKPSNFLLSNAILRLTFRYPTP